MKLLATLALIVGLHALVAVAQKPDNAAQEREALCKTVACRQATTIKLKVDGKRYAEFSFPSGPFVAEGFINILNGERFGVEFDEKDGRLTAPHYVKEIAHADRTVSFELSQLESGTMLTIANPFSRAIVYDCMIQHYKQTGFSETTVLPVRAKLKTFESWPYPIPQVVISNVHYQAQPAGGIGPGPAIGSEGDPNNRRAVITSKPEPEMPKEGPGDLEGTIVLRATFTSDGRVIDIQFMEARPAYFASKGDIALFTQKAIQASKGIKFKPAIKDGRPVSMYMKLEYSFKLSSDDKKPAAPKD